MHQKAATILRLFREHHGFLSGGRIGQELNVSRTAVWKHISSLREAGFQIEAVPSQGYRLLASPDILDGNEISALLGATSVGRRVVCLASTKSTNAEAFHLAEEGAAEGTVVIADSQSGGKGRQGRVWVSPPGVNLYCSVVLRPSIMPYEAPQLTFLSAVAVASAIETTTGLWPEIKWPNDVLVQGGKVAGLLNEMSAETDGVNFVILGIGVNLNMERQQFPADLRQPATSLLLAAGTPVCRNVFAATLFTALDRLYAEFKSSGFGPVRREWMRRCNARDRKVEVRDGDKILARGDFAGIDADGALLVERNDGVIERILAGDVKVI